MGQRIIEDDAIMFISKLYEEVKKLNPHIKEIDLLLALSEVTKATKH